VPPEIEVPPLALPPVELLLLPPFAPPLPAELALEELLELEVDPPLPPEFPAVPVLPPELALLPPLPVEAEDADPRPPLPEPTLFEVVDTLLQERAATDATNRNEASFALHRDVIDDSLGKMTARTKGVYWQDRSEERSLSIVTLAHILLGPIRICSKMNVLLRSARHGLGVRDHHQRGGPTDHAFQDAVECFGIEGGEAFV
jgi:hypothetical protein